MKLVVFGATGRVGQCFVEFALAAGHNVTVFVRDADLVVASGVTKVVGDVFDQDAVKSLLFSAYFDAVIVCLGAKSLKPSSIMTDGVGNIVKAMEHAKIERLIGVSGTAEMPNKTLFGKIYTSILRLTPVGHAVRDHDGALSALKESNLQWTLVGCNYLKSGSTQKKYQTSLVFPGGFKTIHPGDVADFMIKELTEEKHVRQVVGIWY